MIHSFVQFGCNVVVDDRRLIDLYEEYCSLTEGDLDPCYTEIADCSCPNDDPDSSLSDTWSIIDAPWYDPNEPASQDFLGIKVVKIGGISDSTLTRTMTDGLVLGSVAGRPMLKGRSFAFEVQLLHTSFDGRLYGIEWLRRVIETDTCNCEDVLCGNRCSGKDLIIRNFCRALEDGCDKGLRTWKNVFVVDGVTLVEEESNACAERFTNVTFTLQSEQPYSYSCCNSECTIVADGDWHEKCFNWAECSCGNQECVTCVLGPCAEESNKLPQFPALASAKTCYCEPLLSRIQSCNVDGAGNASFEKELSFRLYSGNGGISKFMESGLLNTRISVYENAGNAGPVTDTESYEDWCAANPCAQPLYEITIPYIPHDSTLVIDGITGRATIECASGCEPFNGEINTSGGGLFDAIASCENVSVFVEWDAFNMQIPGDMQSYCEERHPGDTASQAVCMGEDIYVSIPTQLVVHSCRRHLS